jgi:hypothetical protein
MRLPARKASPRMEGSYAMTKKPWKEPTLDDLLADPILDLLLARDRVNREALLAVIEQARRAMAGAAKNEPPQPQEPVGAEVRPLWPAATRLVPCLAG